MSLTPQTVQILTTGSQGTLQIGNSSYSSDLTSGLIISQLLTATTGYWFGLNYHGPNSYIITKVTNSTNTFGLQPINGQAYCVQNSTSAPVNFTIYQNSLQLVLSTPSPAIIPPGGSASFVYNNLATPSSPTAIAVSTKACFSAPAPAPTPTPSPAPAPTPSPMPAPLRQSFFEKHKTLIIVLISLALVALAVGAFFIVKGSGEKISQQQLLT